MESGNSVSSDCWAAAVTKFESAIYSEDANYDVKSLEFVAEAVLAAVDELDAAVPAKFRALLRAHPGVVRGGVAVLGELAYVFGEEKLVMALFARSGYQYLLDFGVWDDPPLEDDALEEYDGELRYCVRDLGFDPKRRPFGIPDAHVWWCWGAGGPPAQ